MKKILLFSILAYSTLSYARIPNSLQDQNITITVKYDKETQEFYDLSATGSNYFNYQIRNDGFEITHGRDGFIGASTEFNNQSIRVGLDTNQDLGVKYLINTSTGAKASLDVGLLSAFFRYQGQSANAHSDNAQNCQSTSPLKQGLNDVRFRLRDPFSYARCNTKFWFSGNHNYGSDVSNIGTIERYFRFDIDQLNKLEFGIYQGNFINQGVYLNQIFNSDPNNIGRTTERYNFNVQLEIKPSINSFKVDSENLAFSVNRQHDRILGKAQTGFNIRGSFHNSQSFDLTFTSLNNASCSGSLCMINTSASTALPYTVKVLDPSTLQEKKVTRSGQKVTIDADQNYQLSSGLFFEFESDNTALSGTFNDVVTVRAELKII